MERGSVPVLTSRSTRFTSVVVFPLPYGFYQRMSGVMADNTFLLPSQSFGHALTL